MKKEPHKENKNKYLEMEQPSVSYTKDTNPTANSDNLNNGIKNSEKWTSEGTLSENADAFNQDDYLLEDNIDLDEDQNQSISTDDDDFEETNERY